MERGKRNPIKVVLTDESDLKPPRGGGGPPKIFGEDDLPERKRTLASEAFSVIKHFKNLNPPKHLPLVARIILKKEAIAKSHRPISLLCNSGCPIIGTQYFGQVLVRASMGGLLKLSKAIIDADKALELAQVSTIERIEPFTANNSAGGIEGIRQIQTILKRSGDPLRLRLFDHMDLKFNKDLEEAFRGLVEGLGLPSPQKLDYASGLLIYKLDKVSPSSIECLANFVGTQNLGFFDQFTVQRQYLNVGSPDEASFPLPDEGRSYPVVGIIDSGTNPADTRLQKWVVARDEEDVPRKQQDNNHGSFVAGLIANGRNLNHGSAKFPSSQAKIVDVVAIPKDGTNEFELLETIKRAVAKYQNIKVWNLSVSRKDQLCTDDAFSSFAIELDSIQKRHDVTFVICSGNYDDLRVKWPPQQKDGTDRIHPPADAALGLSIGSLAHLDRSNSLAKVDEPSPFSRRGPGVAYIPKPELCHYGGNVDSRKSYSQLGVISVDASGSLSECIGTSFSTPLVAAILADIRFRGGRDVSKNLAKAMLIHSAVLKGGPIIPGELPYKGFGVPDEVSAAFSCSDWEISLIFEPKIHPAKRVFSRRDFPLPECFYNEKGEISGEIAITLVYDPPLNPNAGAEYCQSNIEVSLSRYLINEDGKEEAYGGRIPIEPKDHRELYESEQLEHGFKWSPVKVYRKKMTRTEGKDWRIVIELTYRTELMERPPQNVALIVSLIDPQKQAPVYDQVVQRMARSGWITQDLRADTRIRQQLR